MFRKNTKRHVKSDVNECEFNYEMQTSLLHIHSGPKSDTPFNNIMAQKLQNTTHLYCLIKFKNC